MADFESALSELGVALAATDTKLSTSLAEILGVAIQELIEAELTALIGAAPGERGADRATQRAPPRVAVDPGR
jgi:transposase-like protein